MYNIPIKCGQIALVFSFSQLAFLEASTPYAELSRIERVALDMCTHLAQRIQSLEQDKQKLENYIAQLPSTLGKNLSTMLDESRYLQMLNNARNKEIAIENEINSLKADIFTYQNKAFSARISINALSKANARTDLDTNAQPQQ